MIDAVSWDHPDAVALREARRVEIAATYGREDSEPIGSAATGPDVAVFFVACRDSRPVGCGGLRFMGNGVGEVKRMYVEPASRGTGVSTAILKALESWAVEHSVRTLRLETGDLLVAAQRFYEREGFVPIAPFGPYVGSALSRCYEKQLVAGDEGLSREPAVNDDESMITPASDGKAAALLALHAGPGFVLPNAWDAGTARILEQVGFPAIATTSAGIAWACGVPDGGSLDRDTMLEHVARIVAAVGVPVTADLEAGYGDTPDEVGRTVARAVEVGAVGANIEDVGVGGLFEIDEAADRIAAARAAAPKGTFVLNARTDTYFAGTSGDVFAETVRRAVRYLEAGADCVFVPGVVEQDTIRRLATAIPGPLNVVAGLANTIDAPTLFSLGVKRVSLGGSLARAVLSMVERAGRELLDAGTLGFLEGAIGYADLQRRFGA